MKATISSIKQQNYTLLVHESDVMFHDKRCKIPCSHAVEPRPPPPTRPAEEAQAEAETLSLPWTFHAHAHAPGHEHEGTTSHEHPRVRHEQKVMDSPERPPRSSPLQTYPATRRGVSYIPWMKAYSKEVGGVALPHSIARIRSGACHA